MKCIDPWLLNNRRQCPVCKRYVFPNQENSDEERPTRASSEQTPLCALSTNNQQNREMPDSDPYEVGLRLSRTKPSSVYSLAEQRLVSRLTTGVPNISFATNESSESEEDSFLSAGNQRLTTTAPADHFVSHPGRYRHRPLPRRSAGHREESDSALIPPGPANFFVGSLSGTTDNTNVSARSLVDDLSDIETIDDDEMHSVLASSESNAAYVNDDEPSESNITRTQL